VTAALHAIGPGEAAGILTGHPASPTVRTRRDGDRLHIRILLGERPIGGGTLLLGSMGDPPGWSGELEIDNCRWWASAVVGTGILTFTAPRGPGRERAP
jgi:hypothetical protein